MPASPACCLGTLAARPSGLLPVLESPSTDTRHPQATPAPRDRTGGTFVQTSRPLWSWQTHMSQPTASTAFVSAFDRKLSLCSVLHVKRYMTFAFRVGRVSTSSSTYPRGGPIGPRMSFHEKLSCIQISGAGRLRATRHFAAPGTALDCSGIPCYMDRLVISAAVCTPLPSTDRPSRRVASQKDGQTDTWEVCLPGASQNCMSS